MSEQVSLHFGDKCFAVCYQTDVVASHLACHYPITGKPIRRHLIQCDIEKLQFHDQRFRQQDFSLMGAETPASVESIKPISTSSDTVERHFQLHMWNIFAVERVLPSTVRRFAEHSDPLEQVIEVKDMGRDGTRHTRRNGIHDRCIVLSSTLHTRS
ncbi:hypothetical protein FEQ05_02696 [Burkholderia pseudomultivorans]|uniref:Uncharacterized protein n=1 Tax=Burkholderia pseudomultivorans TaxID=1207504 RepID=A0ABU2DWU2_9BURK|nr:hypothetical protein [Burkholderia pseudomultivorans]MDR8734769.1 hypothetical protein [Burkholderia pseudomultivorans]MDR8740961.1 hypothetical protein [Burkholderia pseudomultivorans]MDR8752050.1 hypothetical protein [Burkholderia pseudomultivorans]MDR8777376.1 hypothetical protein [Burkholderia pseudomultivorans]